MKKVTKSKGRVAQGEEEKGASAGLKIVVPANVGGDLRLLPTGNAKATLEKIMLGKGKTSGQPKATFRYTITEEMDSNEEDAPTTIGEAVLETYSLQPQAMFRLNDTYKAVTGERVPQGEWSPEEFEQKLNEDLTGSEWDLVLDNQVPQDGSSTEPRTTVIAKTLAT
jgi:hypothetical protein